LGGVGGVGGREKMKKWSVVRRVERGYDGLSRIRWKNRDREKEEGNRHRKKARGTRHKA